MSLEDEESYKAYFLAIATAHKKLGATAFIYGDEKAFQNEGKSMKGDKLWLEEPEPAGVTDSNSDNYLKEKKGALFICGATSGKFSDEQTQYAKCAEIVEDIISKMIQDYDSFAILIKKGSIKYGRAEYLMPSATKMIGCRLDFTYTDPSGFPYVAENWNIPEEEPEE